MQTMLGVEPDHLPCFKGLVSAKFGPQTPKGGCRGGFPSTISSRGLGVATPRPPWWGFGGSALERNFF